MSKLMIVAAVLALLGTLSCTGTGVNTAPVFTPQSGQIQLTATTTDASFTVVEFVINEAGTPITIKDESLENGNAAVTFDTTQVEDGINFVKAYGVNEAGQRIEILDNSLLVDNGGTGGNGGNGGNAASPSPSASASASAPAGDTEGDLGSDSGVQFRRR